MTFSRWSSLDIDLSKSGAGMDISPPGGPTWRSASALHISSPPEAAETARRVLEVRGGVVRERVTVSPAGRRAMNPTCPKLSVTEISDRTSFPEFFREMVYEAELP